MSKITKVISGYKKKSGEPQSQFNFKVPHKHRLQAITAHLAKGGYIVCAAWFNVYHDKIKVVSKRLK